MPPPSEDTDRQDSEVLSELMRVRGDLNYFISAAIPNRSDAEDVFQEVSMKVWKNRNQYTLGTDFKAWAYTIARFTIMDWRKRYATRRLHYLDSKTIAMLINDTTEELVDADDLQPFKEALEACICKLDTKQEEIMRLHYRDKLPMADLAVRESVTINALKQMMYRVRQKLRKCIELRIHSSQNNLSPQLPR